MREQVISAVDRYVIGAMPVDELERWVVARLQDILDSADDAVIELANEVDSGLVALGEGIADEHEFRDLLASRLRLLETETRVWALDNPVVERVTSGNKGDTRSVFAEVA